MQNKSLSPTGLEWGACGPGTAGGTPSGSNDEQKSQDTKKEILNDTNPAPGCSLA